MGFLEDFGDGFAAPFKWAYHKVEKIDKMTDNLADAGIGAAGGLADLLSGNSNILIYIGVGIVGVVVLPVLLEKLL